MGVRVVAGGSEEAYSPDCQSPLTTVVIARGPNGTSFLKPSRALYCPQQKLKLPTSVYLAPHHHPLPAPPLPLPHFQVLAQASRLPAAPSPNPFLFLHLSSAGLLSVPPDFGLVNSY